MLAMNATSAQVSEPVADVLSAARTGDHDAFAALVTPHVPRLKRLARRFTKSVEDAEDICQESLLKAFMKLHQFTGTQGGATAEFRSWLMRIGTNAAIDFVRRRQSGRFVPLETCDALPSENQDAGSGAERQNPEDSYARKERTQILARTITKLPNELRDVCLLRNVIGLSTREAAARLEISSIAVRLRLFRAHRRLKDSVRLAFGYGEQPGGNAIRCRRANGRNSAAKFLRDSGRTQCAYGD
jgi:RNA polymerase sigma-70 factor (ECF subfamily)